MSQRKRRNKDYFFTTVFDLARRIVRAMFIPILFGVMNNGITLFGVIPGLCSPPVFPPHAKYAVDANPFPLESPILTRAQPAANRNNDGGEVSPRGEKP